jgi:hypothetical protein
VGDVDLQPCEHTAQVDVQLTENGILDIEAGFLGEIWIRRMWPIYHAHRGSLSRPMSEVIIAFENQQW